MRNTEEEACRGARRQGKRFTYHDLLALLDPRSTFASELAGSVDFLVHIPANCSYLLCSPFSHCACKIYSRRRGDLVPLGFFMQCRVPPSPHHTRLTVRTIECPSSLLGTLTRSPHAIIPSDLLSSQRQKE